MANITLQSGFVFDVENLYGPGKITEEEIKAFQPVYEQAHETVMTMRKTGIMKGHLSKDGEPEKVLFTELPYIVEGNLNSPDRIAALQALGQSVKDRVDAVIFFGIGGSYLGGKVLYDVQCGDFWNLRDTQARQGWPKVFFAGNNVAGLMTWGKDQRKLSPSSRLCQDRCRWFTIKI